MDPNLFHIDWEQLMEVLAAVVVLSFVVERALSLIVEHRLYVASLNASGWKEVLAFGLSFFICWNWDLDVVSVILTADQTNWIGQVTTAAVIAGGSKGSIKLFHDVLNIKSKAQKQADAGEVVHPNVDPVAATGSAG